MSCRKWPSSASRGSRRVATCSRGSTCPQQTSGRTFSIPSTSSSEPFTEGTSRRVSKDSPPCELDSTIVFASVLYMRHFLSIVPKRDTRTILVGARRCRAHGRHGGFLPPLMREWKIQEKFFTQVSSKCAMVRSQFYSECVTHPFYFSFRIHAWPLVQSLVQGSPRLLDTVRF